MSQKDTVSILINREEIAGAVVRLAAEISADYREKSPLIIGVLKGSFIFLADLVRKLDIPLEVDFVCLSSYGQGTESSGQVSVVQGLRSQVAGRDVLIIEDIIDTGLTAAFLVDYLNRQNPASIKMCTLTEKPARRQAEVKIDYLGFTVPDKFLIGYGLDCDEKYRNLPDIGCLEGKS